MKNWKNWEDFCNKETMKSVSFVEKKHYLGLRWSDLELFFFVWVSLYCVKENTQFPAFMWQDFRFALASLCSFTKIKILDPSIILALEWSIWLSNIVDEATPKAFSSRKLNYFLEGKTLMLYKDQSITLQRIEFPICVIFSQMKCCFGDYWAICP